MHVYWVTGGVKRPDIVKGLLVFALWSLESKMFGTKVAKFTNWMSQNSNLIFFLWIEQPVSLKSVFDLGSQHYGLFSEYIMYIVRCDCPTAIHLKQLKFLGIAYPS